MFIFRFNKMDFNDAFSHTKSVYVLYFVIFSLPFVYTTASQNGWNVKFNSDKITDLCMLDSFKVDFKFNPKEIDPTFDVNNAIITVNVTDTRILECVQCFLNTTSLKVETNDLISGLFSVKGLFLGRTEIKLTLYNAGKIYTSSPITVAVIKRERLVDRIFIISVAILVSVIFVNFGCALDWTNLIQNLKTPVGPLVGVLSHFIFMPVISFILGRLLFSDSVSMQLGLFYTGISPGGEASNIWIYMLGGNINLSITVTAIVTITSFGFMPLLLFTVGRVLFSDAKMAVPYSRIFPLVFALLIPLAIGYYIQRRHPRFCRWMVKILKPFSASLIIFIIVFASATNLYLFQLFTWRIILAGMGLPWFGYICGGLFSKICGFSTKDVIAVAIETGIQNTGISIFMLKFSLEQPDADLTTIVPVAVALMSPVPLLIWCVIRKVIFTHRGKVTCNSENNKIYEGSLSPTTAVNA